MNLHYVFFVLGLILMGVSIFSNFIFSFMGIILVIVFLIINEYRKEDNDNFFIKHPYSFPFIVISLAVGATVLLSLIEAYAETENEFWYYFSINFISAFYLSFLLFGLEHYFPYRNDNEEKNKQLNIQLNEELIKQINEQLNIQLNEELIKQINEQVKKQLNEQLTNQVNDEVNIQKEHIDE